MIDLAAASILVRELSSAQYEAPPASRRGGPQPSRIGPQAEVRRQGVLRRVASLLTPRSTEGTWPRRNSRTSAC